MNAVYAEYFPGAKPARYCIQCGLVKPGLRRRDRQRGAYRLMRRDRRPLLRRARPGRTAPPLILSSGPRRLGRLLGAQPRRAGGRRTGSSSTIIAAPAAATGRCPTGSSVDDMAGRPARADGRPRHRARQPDRPCRRRVHRRSRSRSTRPSGSRTVCRGQRLRPARSAFRPLLRDPARAAPRQRRRGLRPCPADLPLPGDTGARGTPSG